MRDLIVRHQGVERGRRHRRVAGRAEAAVTPGRALFTR